MRDDPAAAIRESSLRAFLVKEVLAFVKEARTTPGVRRIALVGSLTTAKSNPKDADVLVTIDDEVDLTNLARLGRRLKGRAQSKNSGADIFLANPVGKYIGRVCHWRECRPGIRASCDARNCGRREFLHDDLDAITLGGELVARPPIELWPEIIRRGKVPTDIEELLLRKLEEKGASV